MALNTDSSFPPGGSAPYRISREWCIGDSLTFINLNSENFDSRIETVSSLVLAVSSYAVGLSARSTPTVTLNFNNRTNILSAEIVNNSIDTTKLGGNILQSGKALLTAASLSGLRDVTIGTLTNSQALVWNSSTNRWENQTIATGGAALVDGDKGDITVSGSGTTWLLDTTSGFEAVQTVNTRDGAMTPAKLSTGRPYWSSIGLVGIGNESPNAKLTVGSSFGGTAASKQQTINIGTLPTAVGTVSSLASFGGTTSLNPNGIFLGIKVKNNAIAPDDYTTTALGFTFDYENTSNASQLWLTSPVAGVGRVGINTSTPNHTLTIAGTLSAQDTIFGTITRAANLSGGASGQIPYQTNLNTTGFIAAGTSGQLLQSGGTGAPSWINLSGLTIGAATNLTGGGLQQVVYQSNTGATAYLAAGTSGQILQTNGTTSAPSWISPSSFTVGTATSATKLAGGGLQQIVYQSNTDTTAFLAAGTANSLLQTNGTGSAPSWVNGVSLNSVAATYIRPTITVVTVPTTLVAGQVIGVNTTSSAITITLPASPSTGNIVRVIDSHRKWDTNNCTISRNSQPIEGDNTSDLICDIAGTSVTLVYIDPTRGWSVYFE